VGPFSYQPVRKLEQPPSSAGIQLSDSALGLLHERTEGWVAGLRLAALSLAGYPDSDRFAAEFSGSERTVAEYLLAEVLERQPEPVRRLLLRTSVLDRVNGELADLLTGGSGGERVLQQLEQANTFVVALDARRSWFRYHQLFADLLQLELRGSAPAELPALHAAAGGWYAEHGYPVEAVRHAQAAQDWGLAARLLSDHWVGLGLNGLAATAHEFLARFPVHVIAGIRSWPRGWRGTSWPEGRWRRRNGIWLSPPGDWNRCPRTGVGARKWHSPSCACALPGSAGTSLPWPSRRNGCWHPPGPPTQRGSGWARTCGRWR
jgi:hypothetical protein